MTAVPRMAVQGEQRTIPKGVFAPSDSKAVRKTREDVAFEKVKNERSIATATVSALQRDVSLSLSQLPLYG
jgi:hypothetical protein